MLAVGGAEPGLAYSKFEHEQLTYYAFTLAYECGSTRRGRAIAESEHDRLLEKKRRRLFGTIGGAVHFEGVEDTTVYGGGILYSFGGQPRIPRDFDSYLAFEPGIGYYQHRRAIRRGFDGARGRAWG